VKVYRLPVTLQSPNEDTGGKYVAEIPSLPGCRAWGETAAEAVDLLHSVASAFLESYRERGDPLPPDVEAVSTEAGDTAMSEVLIAL
jgi:predicted RNase H-like HicB family nuclease